MTAVVSEFDAALTGRARTLQLTDGRRFPLSFRRWQAAPDRADGWLLRRCRGATIDLGCGPGRLVRALADRGCIALGVDSSAQAIGLCAERGAAVLHRDVFGPLPGEGGWRHVLLADGNIGIGGDPARLLRRAAALLRPDGSLLVEVAGPGTGLWRGRGRLCPDTGPAGPWFPWAVVGPDALRALAAATGLRLRATHRGGPRHFAELVHTR